MRLFVAICFSDMTLDQLCAAADALRTQGQGHFSPVENLHLTLAFLGQTDTPDAALAALREVTFPAFTLQFAGIGQFGSLYWAGIRENEALRSLQSQLVKHLNVAGFSFEEREFVPHITLARHFTPNSDFSPVSAEQILSLIKEPVRKIALMRSYSDENGTHYETLAIQSLGEK